MADNFKFIQAQPFSLAGSGAIVGDTEITLQSLLDIDGTPIEMSEAGTICFGTLDPGNGSLEEQISFTGITQNSNGTATLTGISNVAFVYPYTQTSGLSKTHAGATPFVISNTSGFYDRLAGKTDDETITGTWTFTNPNYPRMDTDTPFPTVNEQFATKGYADSLTFSGAPDATTTQKGIVELATQAEVDARTAVGGTGAALVPTPDLNRAVLMHDYAASATGTNAYAITLTPNVTGYVSGDVYYFQADVANTGDCTLSVNGLPAIHLKVNGTLTPPDNYIKVNALVMCQYDGINNTMQILSISGRSQLSQDGQEIFGSSGGGTDTYAITVAPVPVAYAIGQVYRFKADVANTGAASLNVNGLGALSILRTDGTALVIGDIVANQIVEVVVYDGSNCKMLSPIANSPKFTNGIDSSWQMDTASGSLTIAHGLGRVPAKVTITAANVGSLPQSYGVYNGTTTSCLWVDATGDPDTDTTNIIHLVADAATPHVQVATITVTATNIVLAFTRSGTNGNAVIPILWEAQG